MSDSQTTVPYGYCQCGCGQKTTVIQRNCAYWGLVKGKPRRFVVGHSRRLTGPYYKVEDRGFETPCWIWQRTIDRTGYGKISVDYKSHTAHRWFYERTVGPIPEGLTLDHLCKVKSCVNPDHLEPVTALENAMRSTNPWASNARKTHCKRGHPFDDANTYIAKSGSRRCRECQRAATREWRRKNAKKE